MLTERLAPTCGSIDAVDTSAAMLVVLDRKVEREGWNHVSTGRSVPADGPAYDLIVCSSVCSFVDDYPATAAELAHRLLPGGLFVQWDWERDPEVEGEDGLSRSEISTALAAAGLDSIDVGTGFEQAIGNVTMRPLMGIGRRPKPG
ncbi:MAG: class I SAM-dependent methyltransferase [Microthrixaceae bacterium]|nr:class I SAM-dependent methyltransferase [Microthrixaceae bacterium]